MFCSAYFLASCVCLFHLWFSSLATTWVVHKTQISMPYRRLQRHKGKCHDQEHHHNCVAAVSAAHAYLQSGLTMACPDCSTDTNSSPLHFYPAKWEIVWTVLEAKGEADFFLPDFIACFPFLRSAFCLPWMVCGKRSDVDFDSKNFCNQKHFEKH